jgi:hypothetical protein
MLPPQSKRYLAAASFTRFRVSESEIVDIKIEQHHWLTEIWRSRCEPNPGILTKSVKGKLARIAIHNLLSFQ